MKVAVITGSRADWNGLGMVAKELRALGHYVEVFSIGQQNHIDVIKADGFKPIIRLTISKKPTGANVAISIGKSAENTARLLKESRPDMVLVLGDRYEILGAACAASAMSFPIAHIGGGDITEGSLDNKFRYAITALADLHFVTNERSHERIVVGRRTAEGIYLVGNPAIDRIAETKIVARETLFSRLGLKPSKHNILVVYHAATQEIDPWTGCEAMLAALSGMEGCSFCIVGTNADTGSVEITKLLTNFTFKHGDKAVMRPNLSPELFYAVLTHFDCMVGNSSAGIVETATFGIAVVNVGNRQSGRSSPGNARTCAPVTDAVLHTVMLSLAEGRKPCANPYGDGHSAPRIAKIMSEWKR